LRPGFTFIELVIAVSILAVLALLVGPNAMKYYREAKENTTQTNLQTIKTNIDDFIRRVNKAPQSLNDLIRKPADLDQRKWGGPYLEAKEVPKDAWDSDFVYKVVPGQHPPYQLYSWGPNGPGSPEEEWILP
jgi:general secretion pathway protein G